MIKERCPECKTIRGGDESMDLCTLGLRDKPCLIEHGGECEYYNEFLKEEENDREFLR